MYIQHKSEVCSHHHCCCGKAISNTYSECVYVALIIQHVKCMCYITLSNCNRTDTQWQQYSTYLHTNNTQYNTMKQNTQKETVVRFQQTQRTFSSPQCSHWLWGPPTLIFNGRGVLSPWVKQMGFEGDHSQPPCVEFYLYSLTRLHGVDMYNFNFY